MVVFGVILVVVGALIILAAMLSTGIEVTIGDGTQDEHVTILGLETSPEVLFLLGVIAAALIFFGLWFMKAGAKRGWRQRKEQKRLEELSVKLDQAEAERRRDHNGEDPRG